MWDPSSLVISHLHDLLSVAKELKLISIPRAPRLGPRVVESMERCWGHGSFGSGAVVAVDTVSLSHTITCALLLS